MPQPERAPRTRRQADPLPDARFTNVELNTDANHTYAFGGLTCPAFALGRIGAVDDFYLIGSIPSESTPGHPLISGNLFDSDGRQLCRIVRNTVDYNHGGVSQTYGSTTGYEILDRLGHLVMRVSTDFTLSDDDESPRWRTVIEGRLYGADGELKIEATGNGGGDTTLSEVHAHIPGLISIGLDDDEMLLADVAIGTHGEITRMFRNETVEDQDVIVDGLLIVNSTFLNCHLKTSSGRFIIRGQNNRFEGGSWGILDEASQVMGLVLRMAEHSVSPAAAAEISAFREHMNRGRSGD